MLVSAGYVQEGNPLGLNLRIKYKNQLKICFRQMMLNFIFLHYMTIQCMKVVLHHRFHLLKLNLKQGTVSLDLKLKNCKGHPFGPHVEQSRKFRPTRKFHLMLRCEEVSELKFYKFYLSFYSGAWQRRGYVCKFSTFCSFLIPWMLCSGGNLFHMLTL
jgi:hypothetical protein